MSVNAKDFKPGLAVAALGVVFGDIGTSPLYTLKTCFTTAHAEPTLENTLGILSLLLWLLTFVVCVKYIGNLMRIDHDGEGGILALLALASPSRSFGIPLKVGALSIVVIAGAAMLFGDGMITPAISVISAIEGIGIVTSSAKPFIVPISVGILIALFFIQSRGTQRVGRVFGPAMIVWFLAIAASGVYGIAHDPGILWAIDPRHAVAFVFGHGVFGILISGAVVLAMTGVEALYADMSHFGRMPITLAWYALVFPALVLNYLGQGALLLHDKAAFEQPFFALAPGPALIPMVVLATAATIIASQALISGAFTLTQQAVNLSLWPRMVIVHTSSKQRGQVYVPLVNLVLGIACIVLVVTFRSSDALASAYGLAVSATMFATSIAFLDVVLRVKHWAKRVAIPLATLFFVVDGLFVATSLPKILEGAWVPLAIAVCIVVTAMTWLEGRRCVSKGLLATQMPLEQYIAESKPAEGDPRGTMVFLTGDQHGVPFIGGTHQWVRARADEEQVVLLTLIREAAPYVEDSERVFVDRRSPRLALVNARFGYMERPQITRIMQGCNAKGLNLDTDETSFFYADPKLSRADVDPLPDWQRGYFRFLARNARPLPDDLEIRAERRVELGVDVAL